MGTAGTGKTALLLAIAGRRTPTGGRVAYHDVTGAGLRSRVTFVPSGAPLPTHLAPCEAVALLLGLARYRVPSRHRIVTALRWSELPDAAMDRRALAPYEERLAVWFAYHRLTARPILALDDLTDAARRGALDDLAGVLADLARSAGAVLFTARDREAAARCATQLLVLAPAGIETIHLPATLPDGRPTW